MEDQSDGTLSGEPEIVIERVQLNIVNNFSLASIGEDWKDCYVSYRPMTVADILEINELQPESMGNAEGLQFIVQHVRKHVVGGKVSVLKDGGQSEVADLASEHLDLLPMSILTDLFSEMTGASSGPKVSDTSDTETSSSEA